MKSIADNLGFSNYDLKLNLLGMSQQYLSQSYIIVNAKDWDLNSIRQRAKPWGKRVANMDKINQLIYQYQDYYKFKHGNLPRNFMQFFELFSTLS